MTSNESELIVLLSDEVKGSSTDPPPTSSFYVTCCLYFTVAVVSAAITWISILALHFHYFFPSASSFSSVVSSFIPPSLSSPSPLSFNVCTPALIPSPSLISSSPSVLEPIVHEWDFLFPEPFAGPYPHVYRPFTVPVVPWKAPESRGWVFDCWFSDPLTLMVVTYIHVSGHRWGDNIEVLINGREDVTKRVLRKGEYMDYGAIAIFHLLTPVRAVNNVTFNLVRNTDRVIEHSFPFHNLSVGTLLPVRTDVVVHFTLFKYDWNLLALTYHYYTEQGFTHFIWAVNGPITEEVRAAVPKVANILLVEWDWEYWVNGAFQLQQAFNTAQTWLARRVLPQVEYVMTTDLDEYPYSRLGEPLLTTIRALPYAPVYTTRNRFAYVMDDWAQWLTDFTVYQNTTTPLRVLPDVDLHTCGERSKSLYHRSFLLDRIPIMGPHLPWPWTDDVVCAFVHPELEHYHVLNYRKGVTSGGVILTSFQEGNFTLAQPQIIKTSSEVASTGNFSGEVVTSTGMKPTEV